MSIFTAKPVENLLRAKSVAIVGASQKGAWPQGIYRNLKGAKFLAEFIYSTRITPICTG
jgi:hypothetical protein